MNEKWKYKGEVTSKERIKNSLIKEKEIEFDKIKKEEKTEDTFIKLIKTRLYKKQFDNYVTPKKEEKKEEKIEYHEKIDMTKEEMESLFKEIVKELDEHACVNELWCHMVVESGEKKEEVKKVKSVNREKESMRLLKRYKNVKIIKNNK